MTEELLSLKEVANKLNCSVDKILRMGIYGKIAISLPLIDGHNREYILPGDLKDLCNAYKGNKPANPFDVALTPEAARNYEKNLDLESHEHETRLAINDYYGTTIEELYLSQEELDRFSNAKPLDVKPELTVFHSMINLKFNEIKITVDPERLVLRVSARDKKDVAIPFSALKLTIKNEITLNSQGKTFMAMAKGCVDLEYGGTKRSIGRLSKSLREAFNTEDTPFVGGKAQFKLYIPKDKQAKYKANRKTFSYSDEIKAPINNADEFLQRCDPEYDKTLDIYSDDPDLGTGD